MRLRATRPRTAAQASSSPELAFTCDTGSGRSGGPIYALNGFIGWLPRLAVHHRRAPARWFVLACALVGAGCSGSPTAVPDVASSVPAAPQVVLAPEDAALRAAGRSLAGAMDVALAPCRALIGSVDADAVEATAMPFDLPALLTACGAARGLYDEQVEALSGRSRPTDVLLGHAARLGDDIDFVVRSIDATGAERRLSVGHLQDAVGQAARGLSEWSAARLYPYQCDYSGDGGRAQWRLDLENDGRDGPNLRAHLERLAFVQGLDPEQVRRRMLDAQGRMLTAYQPLRAAAHARADLSPDERAARGAYLDAYGALLDTYVRVTRAYVTGTVTDSATRSRLIAETNQAMTAWKTAWDTEHARR